MSEAPEVLTRIEGAVGRITLNRPQALHALTTNMCRLMIEALLAWRTDPAVQLVMFDHSGERDRALYDRGGRADERGDPRGAGRAGAGEGLPLAGAL